MKYDVHIYALVRVKVCGIEADSDGQAIQAAQDRVDLHSIFNSDTPRWGSDVREYADETPEFLVDRLNDSGEAASATPYLHKAYFDSIAEYNGGYYCD